MIFLCPCMKSRVLSEFGSLRAQRYFTLLHVIRVHIIFHFSLHKARSGSNKAGTSHFTAMRRVSEIYVKFPQSLLPCVHLTVLTGHGLINLRLRRYVRVRGTCDLAARVFNSWIFCCCALWVLRFVIFCNFLVSFLCLLVMRA